MSAIRLRTIALAAIASSLKEASSSDDHAAEVAYLTSHLQAISTFGQDWRSALARYETDPTIEDKALLNLANQLKMDVVELMAIVLSVAVEEDSMLGRSLAYVQAPVGGSRPTLGLIASVFRDIQPNGGHNEVMYELASGPAVQSGLLLLSGGGLPLPEQHTSVPAHLCLALADRDGYIPGTTLGMGNIPSVPLPASFTHEAERLARALQKEKGLATNHALVLRTGSRTEGRSMATAIANLLSMRPLFIESDQLAGLSPWLLLRGLLPVFCFELAPGEHKQIPALPLYDGPILVLSGTDGSVDTASGTVLSWSLPVPSRQERQQLWEQALRNGHNSAAATQREHTSLGSLPVELAHDHRHSSGRIAHLGRLAFQQSRLEGRDKPLKKDIVAVSWIGETGGLDALAQPLTDPVPDEALITTSTLQRELDILLLRCRNRDELAAGLGASATTRYHPGVRALLVGPSGTGKTLAAGWLATKLGLPLYRVDLAAVTSKYIGETEKNLALLLARAEQAEVILLFDEADSLFGKRTDVKEANDRFANAQTNYLLQRIETFDGITLLTSNSRGRFDSAFARRLDLIVDFPLPGPDERRQLWEAHLGNNHTLPPRSINQLALAADLTGGNIRNVVLTAAVLARHASRQIEWDDIRQGLETEYSKLGRQVPLELK